MLFNERLVSLMEEKCLSQSQLAKALNVRQATVSSWCQGRTTPDLKTLILLCKFFNVSGDYLMQGEEYPRTNLDDELMKAIQTAGKEGLFEVAALEKIFANKSIREIQKEFNASNVYPTDGIISFEEVGSISAGYNGIIDEVRTGNKVEIPLSALGNKNPDDYFVLYVKGNSMYPKLIEGDRILCLRCNSVDSGDLAVVLYNGDEATVKKVHYVYGEDWLELIPINPEYQTKRIEKHDLENCRVLGKVVKLIRDF